MLEPKNILVQISAKDGIIDGETKNCLARQIALDKVQILKIASFSLNGIALDARCCIFFVAIFGDKLRDQCFAIYKSKKKMVIKKSYLNTRRMGANGPFSTKPIISMMEWYHTTKTASFATSNKGTNDFHVRLLSSMQR